MTNLIIEKLLAKTKRTDIPEFAPGDSIRVHVKIKEGDKERLQAFEGVVIARSRGPQASFTVRKISFGHGVERIFPLHSKVVDRVELMRSSKVTPSTSSITIRSWLSTRSAVYKEAMLGWLSPARTLISFRKRSASSAESRKSGSSTFIASQRSEMRLRTL